MWQSITIVFSLILIGLFGMIFFFDLGDQEKSNTDFMVKNHNRINSYFEEIPYKKGDKISYIFVLEPGRKIEDVDIDYDGLKHFLSINNMDLDYNIYSRDGEDLIVVKINGVKNTSGHTRSIDKSKIKNFVSVYYSDNITNHSSNSEQSGENNNESLLQEAQDDRDSEENKQERVENIDNNSENIQDSNEYSGKIHLDTTEINVNANTLLELVGSDSGEYSYVNIGDQQLDVIHEDNKAFVNINGNNFDKGTYSVVFENEDGGTKKSDQEVSFVDEERNIYIIDIHPNVVGKEKSDVVSVTGGGFDSLVSVQLSNNQILESTDFDVISDHTVMIKIPSDLEEGDYFFNLMTRERIYTMKNQTFEVKKFD